MRHNINSLYADASETGPRHASQGGQNNNDYWANFLQTHPGYTPPTPHWHPNVPYPNAPHDGGAQDRANTAAATSGLEQANTYQYYVDNAPTIWDKLGPAIAIGMATGGVGSAVGTGVGAAIGGTTGTVVGGAAGGAVAGGLSSAVQGGDNFLKNTLIGGVLGGVGGGFKASGWGGDATSYLTDQGIPPDLAKAIVAAGTGAGKGAIGSGLRGGDLGAGAAGGAFNAGVGSVGGSIFSNGANIFGSNSTDVKTDPSNFTPNQAPTMSYDPNFDPSGSPWNTPTDTTGTGVGPLLDTTGNGTGDLSFLDPNGGGGSNSPTGGWLPTDSSGNVMSGGGGGGNTNWGALLSKLLGGGGSGGGGAGQYGNLLQRLFGYGASGAGGFLQHGAAVDAANKYAQQTKFNPFNIATNNGTTGFANGVGTSTLSPQAAQRAADLQSLTHARAGDLTKGNDAQVKGIFDNLQQSQRDSNNKSFQSNLDSQFGNGILASTAGQYDTQAALDAINKQTTNNHITAQNMGSQIQQDQLRQLTAGLNGTDQMTQQQLEQMRLGGTLGQEQSYANGQAYKPMVNANSTSPWGDLLSNMGGNSLNSGNNDQLIQMLRQLLGGG